MIDLRSDFLSSPTPAMLAAMAAAAGMDKGYGPRGDPNQQRLEQRAAELLGKEDALFMPTCMMANLVAAMVAVKPGEAILLDQSSHMLRSESGALAAHARALALPIESVRGVIDPDRLAAMVDPGGMQQPRTAMLALENTHNKAGGVALPASLLQAQREAVGSIWIHLDGSRLLNAAAALGETASALARHADSVSLSLNKGLSAPAGAILAGPSSFIERATEVRQQLGGGWRPVGMLAAAALVGLETMVPQLAVDHRNAARIARVLDACDGISMDLESVQTNIVRGRLRHPRVTPGDLESALLDAGIRLSVGEDGSFRVVTYHDITPAAAEKVCRVLREILGARQAPTAPR